MSFSQNNEETIIREYFTDRVGRFLDIGAHDGETFSNTLAIALAGWSGVLVEPAPGPFLALLNRYGSSDRHTLVNAAIGASAGMVNFHESNGDMVGSFVESHVAKWSSITKFRPYMLSVVTPDQLLQTVGCVFDFINVDVEGFSADLFHMLVAAGASAAVWCVEHDGKADEVVKTGVSIGLREIARNGENIIIGVPK